MNPLVEVRNFTPSSTELVSGSVPAGVAVPGQIEHGQVAGELPTVTVTPAPGVCMFALSSVARLRIVIEPAVDGVKA